MKVRVFNFLSQGLLAFLPALMIAVLSREDLSIAAEMSFGFAVIGVTISMAYLGMRPYVSLNGFLTNSKGGDIYFRFINIIFASCLVLLMMYYMERLTWVIYFALLLKFSEACIDLKNGFDFNEFGVEVASLALFKGSIIRALLLFSFFIFTASEIGERYPFLMLGALFTLIVFFLKLKGSTKVMYMRKVEFIDAYKKVVFFSLATVICSILSVIPRFVLPVEIAENQVMLVALSISPLLGVLFQSVWLSSMHKLKKGRVAYFVFFIELILIVLLVWIFKPLWVKLIPVIYGINDKYLIDVFADIIISISIFFAGMTMMNIYKYYFAWFEAVMYFVSIMVFLILFYIFSVNLVDCLVISGCAMMVSYIAYCCSQFYNSLRG